MEGQLRPLCLKNNLNYVPKVFFKYTSTNPVVVERRTEEGPTAWYLSYFILPLFGH